MELPEFLSKDSDAEIRLKAIVFALLMSLRATMKDTLLKQSFWIIIPPWILPSFIKVVAYYLEHEAEIKALIDSNAGEIRRQADLPRTTPDLAGPSSPNGGQAPGGGVIAHAAGVSSGRKSPRAPLAAHPTA